MKARQRHRRDAPRQGRASLTVTAQPIDSPEWRPNFCKTSAETLSHRTPTPVQRNSPDTNLTVQVSATAQRPFSRFGLLRTNELETQIAAPTWLGHHCAQSSQQLINSANRSMTTGVSIRVHDTGCQSSADGNPSRPCRTTSLARGPNDWLVQMANGRWQRSFNPATPPPPSCRMGGPLAASRLPSAPLRGSLRSALTRPRVPTEKRQLGGGGVAWGVDRVSPERAGVCSEGGS